MLSIYRFNNRAFVHILDPLRLVRCVERNKTRCEQNVPQYGNYINFFMVTAVLIHYLELLRQEMVRNTDGIILETVKQANLTLQQRILLEIHFRICFVCSRDHDGCNCLSRFSILRAFRRCYYANSPNLFECFVQHVNGVSGQFPGYSTLLRRIEHRFIGLPTCENVTETL